VFARAEASSGSAAGSINNVVLANRMTYARHHAFTERVFERLGSDLGRLVAFFQQVDADYAAAADAQATPADAPALRDTPAKSGPRQRALPLPRPSTAGRSTGGARPTRPPAKTAARPEAAPGKAAAAGKAAADAGAEAETPAALLARIQAAEGTVLALAARLLAGR
jgi:hypothetical protein